MNAQWHAALDALFGGNIPEKASWTGTAAIVNVLAQVASAPNHLFLPDKGGQDLTAVRVSPRDPALLEWVPAEADEFAQWAYVLKPGRLDFVLPAGKTDLAYFMLEAEAMDPSLVFPSSYSSCAYREELVEVPGGTYLQKQYWDRGEDANGTPLPKGCRLLNRYGKGGRFALFGKGSVYNSNNSVFDAYDAIHMHPAKFDQLIEKLASI